MNVEILERQEIKAEAPEVPVVSNAPVPESEDATYTAYVRYVFRPQPMPFLGRPVVRKLPADWPYPPEEGYE